MTRPEIQSRPTGEPRPLVFLGGIVISGAFLVATWLVDWAVVSITARWLLKRAPIWVSARLYGLGAWVVVGGRWLVVAGVVIGAVAFFLRRFSGWLTGFSASRLTDLAVLLAGRRRSEVRDEWPAHLAGESGHDPDTRVKIRQALGFVASAIQFRLADAAELAWRPADAVLGSRCLSNLLVWGPVVATLVAIVRHDGRFGLVADDQDPVALGAFLYVVIKTGRWWRGVKPPEPPTRRARQ